MKKTGAKKTTATSLMDLSNELLVVIAQNLDKDAEIPFPSFFPHWQNLASPIDRSSSRDIRNFKNVNNRSRSLVVLSGCHLVISSEESLNAWMERAPDKQFLSIRRLSVTVSAKEDMTWEEAQRRLEVFLRFLHRLPNLEEINMKGKRSIFCYHYEEPDAAVRLLTGYKRHRSLISFSTDFDCVDCCSIIPGLMPRIMYSMRHIKVGLGDIEDFDDYERFERDSISYSAILGTVMRGVRDLTIRVPSYLSGLELLEIISNGFPNVVNVNVSRYWHTSVGGGDTIEIGSAINSHEPEYEIKEHSQGRLIETLERMKCLKTLDLGLSLRVDGYLGPNEGDEFESGMDLEHYNMLMSIQASGPWSGYVYEDAQRWIAVEMIKACPTLEQGWWWNFLATRSFRTEWSRLKGERYEPLAMASIEIIRGPIFGYPDEFTRCTTGTEFPTPNHP